ncbi:DUF1128 family protein [Phocicoccus pinnipedialis]|uniref:Uncharacterized protein n=1 Tax=Phocicoccus pinnipedialis TaxID=110845 RepID=A0A6V7RMC9_9BACL|nr:DUF1128 family protein [Jeotgalicoccus pinnipedialis]MBP1940243.1 uncharacterized protein YfkK (UPF0435 family) [Jeotgalicoccus pinnipedialis]CAD2079528.1 hypothetical protein JEOPIN946_01583 [Jeotgalicoccus pinnipedialis]
MDISKMLEDIEENLNVVNKGILKAKDFSEDNYVKIKEVHEFVSSRNKFSPQETTMILDELKNLRN